MKKLITIIILLFTLGVSAQAEHPRGVIMGGATELGTVLGTTRTLVLDPATNLVKWVEVQNFPSQNLLPLNNFWTGSNTFNLPINVADATLDIQAISMGQANLMYEPTLGNPVIDGQILSSTAAGARSWVNNNSISVSGDQGIAITGTASDPIVNLGGNINTDAVVTINQTGNQEESLTFSGSLTDGGNHLFQISPSAYIKRLTLGDNRFGEFVIGPTQASLSIGQFGTPDFQGSILVSSGTKEISITARDVLNDQDTRIRLTDTTITIKTRAIKEGTATPGQVIRLLDLEGNVEYADAGEGVLGLENRFSVSPTNIAIMNEVSATAINFESFSDSSSIPGGISTFDGTDLIITAGSTRDVEVSAIIHTTGDFEMERTLYFRDKSDAIGIRLGDGALDSPVSSIGTYGLGSSNREVKAVIRRGTTITLNLIHEVSSGNHRIKTGSYIYIKEL